MELLTETSTEAWTLEWTPVPSRDRSEPCKDAIRLEAMASRSKDATRGLLALLLGARSY